MSSVIDTSPAVAPSPEAPAGWRSAVPSALAVAAVAGVFAVVAYRRRWISDDGLIVTRTVRQLLAGNGPVVNVGERAEANTSTLWTYLLAAGTWVTGLDPGYLAVLLGIALTVLALVLGLDAARLLHSRRGPGALSLPLGGLVVLGLPPFWDYASSGLETGLTFVWITGTWWAVVRCAGGRRLPGAWATTALCGLAPLVRPELALVGAAYLVALYVALCPSWRRTVALLAVAAAVPAAYQVFRMGYYGILVPLTAVSKEAGSAQWERGWDYFGDFATPYQLWLPLLLVAGALAALVVRDRRDSTALVLIAAPALSAVALTLYVARVGGDFMHARMLLPPLLLLLLPVFAVPLRRPGARTVALGTLAAVVVAAGWTVLSALHWRPAYVLEQDVPISAAGVADERAFWSLMTNSPHPVTAVPYLALAEANADAAEAARDNTTPTLVWPTPPDRYVESQLRTDLPWRSGILQDTLGTGGAIAQLDEAVVDPVGLSYPLAAHAELGARGRPGHEKRLGATWIAADLLRPDSRLAPGIDQAQVAAARQVLACPELDELTRSVRDPLTLSRFWDNLTGAVHRTSMRLPADLEQARALYC